MSDQLERAIAIMGAGWEPEMADQITTCGGCAKKIEPQFEPMAEGDGVVLSPLCTECKAKELLWHETHCEWCHKELPRIELEWGGMQVCSDACREAFGA